MIISKSMEVIMLKKQLLLVLVSSLYIPVILFAQHPASHSAAIHDMVADVDPQPLLAQAIRLREALSFLGSSLSHQDEQSLRDLQHRPLTPEITMLIQKILDPYCLAVIDINPESRVKVIRGPAKAKLIQSGWVSFLVKVNNEAGSTAQLQVESPNAATPLYAPSFDP